MYFGGFCQAIGCFGILWGVRAVATLVTDPENSALPFCARIMI